VCLFQQLIVSLDRPGDPLKREFAAKPFEVRMGTPQIIRPERCGRRSRNVLLAWR
jgi:hypothetical protein